MQGRDERFSWVLFSIPQKALKTEVPDLRETVGAFARMPYERVELSVRDSFFSVSAPEIITGHRSFPRHRSFPFVRNK
jgi:hypothetical protein